MKRAGIANVPPQESLLIALFQLALAVVSPCLPVHGEWITAGDLAQALPVFAQLPPATEVGRSPAPGAQRIFHRLELNRLLRQFSLQGELTKQGQLASEPCFAWPLRQLATEPLIAAMSQILSVDPGAIELKDYSRFPVPPGELLFLRAGLSPVPGARSDLLFWRGFVVYSKDRRLPIWAKIRVHAPAPRIVAKTELLPNVPITADQVEATVSTQPVGDTRYATSIDEVVGRVPRARIEPGAAIQGSQLTAAPDVRAGDSVQLEVRNGALSIRTSAKAERSGRSGEIIPLINPLSGARFAARVEGPSKASVTVTSSAKPAFLPKAKPLPAEENR